MESNNVINYTNVSNATNRLIPFNVGGKSCVALVHDFLSNGVPDYIVMGIMAEGNTYMDSSARAFIWRDLQEYIDAYNKFAPEVITQHNRALFVPYGRELDIVPNANQVFPTPESKIPYFRFFEFIKKQLFFTREGYDLLTQKFLITHGSIHRTVCVSNEGMAIPASVYGTKLTMAPNYVPIEGQVTPFMPISFYGSNYFFTADEFIKDKAEDPNSVSKVNDYNLMTYVQLNDMKVTDFLSRLDPEKNHLARDFRAMRGNSSLDVFDFYAQLLQVMFEEKYIIPENLRDGQRKAV